MKKRKCLSEKGSERAKVLLLTRKRDSPPSLHVETEPHTHLDVHKPFPPFAPPSFSCSFPLAPPGSEPDIPAGPVSLKWLVGAGSRYRGRDWRKPICLAVGNGPGPGVNQQTQHTAHSVHTDTHTHTHTHTYKYKHCPLCPHSAAVTRPARFGG